MTDTADHLITDQQVKAILAALRASLVFLPQDKDRIDFIKTQLRNIGQNEGLAAGIYNDIFVQGPAGPTPTPTPDDTFGPVPRAQPFVVAPPGLSSMSQRDRSLESLLADPQGIRARSRERGIQGAFGAQRSDFGPAGQRALDRSFSRFEDVGPITQFGNPAQQGERFEQFLSSPRGTKGGLTAGLRSIVGSQANDPRGESARLFQDRFPDVESAALAAFQPFLSSVAPDTRARIQQALIEQFAGVVANDQLGSRQAGAPLKLLEEFLRGGVLPGARR
jgi:hypothetical protein